MELQLTETHVREVMGELARVKRTVAEEIEHVGTDNFHSGDDMLEALSQLSNALTLLRILADGLESELEDKKKEGASEYTESHDPSG